LPVLGLHGVGRASWEAAVNLAVYVMHVPGTRRDELSALIRRLPVNTVIMSDPERRGVWWNARRCWEEGLKTSAEWIIVMNDDVLPCDDFLETAKRALATRSPRDPVCFYTNHKGATCEALADGGWYTTVDGLVGVACALHRTTVAEFLEWHDKYKNERDYPDDARINLFAMATGRLIHTTVPSLVEHKLPGESLVGNELDERRTAIVPPSATLATVDWTKEPVHFGKMYEDNAWDMIVQTRPIEWTPALIEATYVAHRRGLPTLKEPFVAIAAPMYRESATVARICSTSRVQARLDLKQHGIESDSIPIAGDSLICRMRQRAVHMFLETPATHMLFWDCDIECLTPDCVRKMLETGHDVIAGACPFKDMSGRTVCNLPEGVKPVVGDDGCVEVQDAGTGFLLISRRAILNMMAAYPDLQHWSTSMDHHRGAPLWALFDTGIIDGIYQSEDYYFCRLWQRLGGKVYVYAPARFKHYGEHGYEGSFMAQHGLS
jgi:hypothetical protein